VSRRNIWNVSVASEIKSECNFILCMTFFSPNAVCMFSRMVEVRQAVGRKSNCRSLSQHDVKHVVPTPLSRIRVGKKKDAVCMFPRMIEVRQAVGRKSNCRSLSQHDEKHVVPTPLSGIRVGKKRCGLYVPKES
jgi:hypothetical protein